jgi:hypothetical protein
MKLPHSLPLPMRPAGFLLPTLAALALASCAAPPTSPPASQQPAAPSPPSAPPNTHVSDNLNAADLAFRDGMDGCPSVSIAIMAANSPTMYGPTSPAQRAELKPYADRCKLRFEP